MISSAPSSEKITVKLIDYGFANSFVKANGKPI
jgi:hypothetical protein